MCVCQCVCVSMCVCVCVCVCVRARARAHELIYVIVCVSVCECVCMHRINVRQKRAHEGGERADKKRGRGKYLYSPTNLIQNRREIPPTKVLFVNNEATELKNNNKKTTSVA